MTFPHALKRAATRVDFIKRTGRYGPFILEFSEVSQFYYLCGINFAARRPNIGLPICVSDSLMDFFFRKTFSPVADTTLNSILPEKVAVNDLKNNQSGIIKNFQLFHRPRDQLEEDGDVLLVLAVLAARVETELPLQVHAVSRDEELVRLDVFS